MLKDYEWEFCTALHKKLKEKIKGRIFTTVKEDKLMVEVTMGKVEYKIVFDNFTQRLNEGYTTDDVVRSVLSAYRNYIDGLYFV